MLFAADYQNSSVLVETTAGKIWRVFWDTTVVMKSVILSIFI